MHNAQSNSDHLIPIPADAKQSEPRLSIVREGEEKKYRFEKVRDSRGRSIDRLWSRNGRYYCQTRLPGKRGSRRVPLLDDHNRPVETVQQAKAALDKLLAGKREGHLPGPRITPPFDEYAAHYVGWLKATKAKSPLTIMKEEGALKGWKDFFGSTRLNQITRQHINEYVKQRTTGGVSNRTVNLDVIALQHLLRFAKNEGILRHSLPTDDWRPLKYTAPKRSLIAADVIDRLCQAALAQVDGFEQGQIRPVLKYENGKQIADYIKLLAYSGARRQAGLTARWKHVDWNNRQIAFDTKFDRRVVVDFNEKLEAHLRDMFERRTDPENPWLFPSPRPGEVAGHWITPHKTLMAVCRDAGVQDFKLHDLRHWFISYCVMSGIDYMTIAKWVGHADGGILIGKVYGHLANEHAQAAARKVSFEAGTIVDKPAQALSTQQLAAALSTALSLIQKNQQIAPEVR